MGLRRMARRAVTQLTDITHECGKEAMMFLGDHWIGTEPFMDEFASIGIDAVVGLPQRCTYVPDPT